MTQPTLEQRVSLLEQSVAELLASRDNANGIKKDWRSTIGMFAGDTVIREIQEEGRKIREAERERVRQGILDDES